MLGDDDCLLKGYFSTSNRLIEEYSGPDLIHTNAYLYVYPGVLPHAPRGYTARWTYEIFKTDRPYYLSKETAKELVRRTMNFEVGFGWNMQFSLVSFRLIHELKRLGPFYQSPYPDYYGTNLIFLKAKRILVYPSPLVAIGMTQQSFGAYYFSNREQQGVEFLKNRMPESYQGLSHLVLPGEQHNTSWLYAVETLRKNLGSEFDDLRVNYRRYRFLQIYSSYRAYYFDKRLQKSQIAGLRQMMTWYEKAYSIGIHLLFGFIRLFRLNSHNRAIRKLQNLIGQYPPDTLEMLRVENNDQNILELFERQSKE